MTVTGLLIIVALWALLIALAFGLCAAARRGDDLAQAARERYEDARCRR